MSRLRLQEIEALKVAFGPAGLVLDHALEGFRGEGISRTVKRNRHAAAIGVTVVLMRAGLAVKNKTVSVPPARAHRAR